MEDSIYDSDIEFHVFKYKTKKGRRYLSKKFEQKTISTTVTVVDIDDAQSNVYLLKRMARSADLNPNALNTEYKIKITKFTLGKKVGVKILSHVSAAGTETAVDYQPGGIYQFIASSGTGNPANTVGF